ncbi:hypothetical protein Dsin_017839 [Dipteronia sinensis]|uniref:Uncharacterized protein n=1 Tax=Dipteronia sinensis TaxID=43782 RepID=A0AAE0AGQ1_9ROSI|nr:hypothetical protein Dsin_017839 [Dipteronia sinensis]
MTDPRNSDYVVESGAKQDEEEDKQRNKKEAEELGDSMKVLENQTLICLILGKKKSKKQRQNKGERIIRGETLDSKRQMDILDGLGEMKSLKSRHESVSLVSIIESLQEKEKNKLEEDQEDDEELIRSIFHKRKRLPENDDSIQNKLKNSEEIPLMTQSLTKVTLNSSVKVIVVRRSAVKKSTGLQSLCQYDNYNE